MKKRFMMLIVFLLVTSAMAAEDTRDGVTGEDTVRESTTNDESTKDRVCQMVMTTAWNPQTGKCGDFPTPCDVPRGWKTIPRCEDIPVIAPPKPITTQPIGATPFPRGLQEDETCVVRCMKAGLSKERCRFTCSNSEDKPPATIRPITPGDRDEDCVARCVRAGTDKVRCVKTCSGVAKPFIETNPVENCLARCVESGEDERVCKNSCVRKDVEHISDAGKAHRAFAFTNDEFTLDELRKIAQLDREKAKRILDASDAAQVKERISRLKVIRAEDIYKKRAVAREKMEDARDRYEKARARYESLRDESENRDKVFKEVKAKLKDCTENCEELEDEILKRAKEHVTASGERVLTHIEKILAKIEENENIDSERAEELVTKLKDAHASVEKALVLVQQATTKDKLRAAAKEIATIWKRISHVAKAGAAHVVSGKIGEIVVRSRQLEVKLEKLLTEIDERGVEIENLESMTDTFGVLIAEARELHKESESLLDQVAVIRSTKRLLTVEERSQLTETITQAKGLSKDAQTKLKDAHRILVEIAKGLHEADASLEGAEDEELVEDESQEEGDEE